MSSEESSRDLVIQCLDAGACECLSKPVRHNDLATVLEHIRQRMSGSNGKIGAPVDAVGAVGSLSSGEAAGNSGSNKDPASGGAMEGANGSGRAGSRGERSGSGEEDGGRANRRPGSGGDASGAGSGAGGGSGGGSGSNGSGGGTDGSGSNGRGEEQSSAGSRSLRPPAALHLPVGGPSSNYHSSEGASDTSSRAHFANNLKVKGVLDPPPFTNLASTTPPSAAAEKQGSEGEEDEIGGSGGEGSPDTDEQDRENGQRRDEDEVMEEQGEIDEEPPRSQMPNGGNRILPRGLLELAHLGNCREQEAHALAVQQQKSYHAVVEDEAAARHQKMMATQNAASRGSLKHSNSCSAFSAFGVPGDMEEASYYNRFPHELAGHPHGPHGRPLHPAGHPYGHPRPPHMEGHPSHYGHHPVHQAPPPHYAHHPPPFPYPMMHPMMHGWGGMGLGGMPRMPPGIRPGGMPSGMSSHMTNYYNQAAMQMVRTASTLPSTPGPFPLSLPPGPNNFRELQFQRHPQAIPRHHS